MTSTEGMFTLLVSEGQRVRAKVIAAAFTLTNRLFFTLLLFLKEVQGTIKHIAPMSGFQ